MFFLKTLTHKIQLHPSYFGPSLSDYLRKQLKAEVEGTCTGKVGFIVKVTGIIDVGDGVILPGGDGKAEFESTYNAVVLKPFKGEVVDALVTNVNKMGFFATVGPLQIFTSVHLLPVDFKFQPDSNPAEYASADGSTIVKGKKVRLRIVGTRIDANEIFAVGLMKEDYLGPFD
ncbi:putative DNA-directed RNA polymerase II chain Rpb7 [Tilletiopsis washingtonensis]|uniref:Putative DNA-directed RNA polymerase II chain Rpb7 n=1 Tax=Tilletiopsis washingtonensis TaxID=58919 RepID=A0A316Z025_9BASI|nr:putative DNA-directed RNA polymerase II chain Rpb7 [Tilletiopsis washingtonensis]PWN94821.1 putative DNA-directed RNA polymerase II chain Rpb7 [Tilletiopsis washingtonensis]